MNEDNIAALDQSIGHDGSCWLATLPVPTSTICSAASLCWLLFLQPIVLIEFYNLVLIERYNLVLIECYNRC
jgi:hypothetical protein